jgi:hypothetical protein
VESKSIIKEHINIQYKFDDYIENNGTINRIRQLNELNYVALKKISKILIDEGYNGYKGKSISRDVVRNIINKYM